VGGGVGVVLRLAWGGGRAGGEIKNPARGVGWWRNKKKKKDQPPPWKKIKKCLVCGRSTPPLGGWRGGHNRGGNKTTKIPQNKIRWGRGMFVGPPSPPPPQTQNEEVHPPPTTSPPPNMRHKKKKHKQTTGTPPHNKTTGGWVAMGNAFFSRASLMWFPPTPTPFGWG